MEISARNQIKGKIVSIKKGTVMCEVVVDIGGQSLTAAITVGSAEHLKLKEGDQVSVIVKATEVMIGK